MKTTEKNYILRSNIIGAIGVAVHALRKEDEKISPDFKSGFRAGLEENLERMRAGEDLEIR